jgi:CDP-diacylglycerol--glycerol-3-phosphate 3-phosphatidyltransferase
MDMDFKKKWLDSVAHPNSLTMFRIAAVPLLIAIMTSPSRLSGFFAVLVFGAAAVTDYFDGYVARRFGLVSSLGKIMDPLADKLLVSSAFIMMIPHGRVPAWVICVIIGRELAVTGLRNVISEKGEDVSASNLGKWKTGFQIAAIIPLLLHYTYLGVDFHAIGSVLLWVALFVTIWSGADYFVRFRKLLLT